MRIDQRESFATHPALLSLARSYDLLVSSLGLLAALGLLFMPLLITADVVLRLFNIGSIKWGVDVCEYILFISTYIGAPWLLRLGLHVRVDIFVLSLPKLLVRKFEQFLDLTGAIICGVMTYYGAVAALDAYKLDLKQYKAITVADWPFHLVFTLSMLLLAIEFIRRLPRPEEALATKDPLVGV